MNTAFWKGFQKKAESENPFAIWAEQADDEQKALDEKKAKPYRSDPRDLSEGYPPDAWYRYWP